MGLSKVVAKTTYTSEQKADALAIYVEDGLAAAATRTGIAKGTIASWANREGLQTSCTPEKVRAAAAISRANVEQRKATLAEKLLEVAELGVAIEVEMLAGRDATLRDVVGARTRAIHDLQLLSGAATSRPEVGVPDRAAAEERLAKVLDLASRRTA